MSFRKSAEFAHLVVMFDTLKLPSVLDQLHDFSLITITSTTNFSIHYNYTVIKTSNYNCS